MVRRRGQTGAEWRVLRVLESDVLIQSKGSTGVPVGYQFYPVGRGSGVYFTVVSTSRRRPTCLIVTKVGLMP